MKIKFKNAVLLVLVGIFSAGCSRNEMDLPAGYKVSISTGGVSFVMAYVPGGTFPTGTGTHTRPTDIGANPSTVSSPYWIAETEVTYELWYTVRTWAIANGYTFTNPGIEGHDGVLIPVTGALPTSAKQEPVTTINWREAMVWCNALTEFYNANYGSDAALDPVYYTADHVTPIRSADDNIAITHTTDGSQDMPYIKPSAKGFRLPGNMEWECASRYKEGTNWTAGNFASGALDWAWDGVSANPLDTAIAGPTWSVAWHIINSGSSTKPVAGKTANRLGLYDMSGNVWEWCFDWYAIGGSRFSVGGSYFDSAEIQQVGLVRFNAPDYQDLGIGFRIARSAH